MSSLILKLKALQGKNSQATKQTITKRLAYFFLFSFLHMLVILDILILGHHHLAPLPGPAYSCCFSISPGDLTFRHASVATRGTTNIQNPNLVIPYLWPKSCIKPKTNWFNYGQLKILLENYYFTSLWYFLNSLTPTPKPEKENKRRKMAYGNSIQCSALPCLSETRPPTCPLPQGAHYSSEQQAKRKKKSKPHTCRKI